MNLGPNIQQRDAKIILRGTPVMHSTANLYENFAASATRHR